MNTITLLPSQLRGTMILAELSNSLANAVMSDMWRVERLFNNVSLLTCFIIHSYNHPHLYTFRLVVPAREYDDWLAVVAIITPTMVKTGYAATYLLRILNDRKIESSILFSYFIDRPY
jgi:hypothetical protein